MSPQATPEGRRLAVVPATLSQADDYIDRSRRHHQARRGGLFALACSDSSGKVHGVVIVDQPVARMLDDGWTCEVTRCATDGEPNACSLLYGSAWRAARALGYRRLVTYMLATEAGASLRGAGFRPVCRVRGRSWHSVARPRPGYCVCGDKVRWEITRGGACGPGTTHQVSDDEEVIVPFPFKTCLRVLTGGLARPTPPRDFHGGEAA